MSLDRAVLAFAGSVVLLSVLLGWAISPWFLWITAFAGANLVQSAFTGFCPAAKVLRRLGFHPGAAR